MKNIYTKLFNLQQAVKAIEKDSTNPYFKSKYFDINKLIETIKPILGEQKLTILQPLTMIGEKWAIKTIIADTESGETLEDTVLLPDNTDVQKMGAIITYFRRYTLQSWLLLGAEDDDGNSVGKPAEKPKQPARTPVPENAIPFN